jgi:hypothetical protein
MKNGSDLFNFAFRKYPILSINKKNAIGFNEINKNGETRITLF